MPDITVITAWVSDHRALAIAVAAVAAVIILSVVAAQVWAGYRGRTLSARASAFFGIVQAGVAYVTITGVYEFWAHRVDVPQWDAAGIAVIVEAVTWAAVADIYVHGAKPGSTGLGGSGGLFWAAILGGGTMAVIGSPSPAVAIGRTVVVALGAMMWHVRVRQRTNRDTQPTRFAITPRTILLRAGILIPSDADVRQSSREWQVRTLTRAITRAAKTGWWQAAPRALGERTIRRVMEAGDAAMVKDAQARHALQHVLRTELSPTSASMSAAIDAAREALTPAVAVEPEPTTPPEPPKVEVPKPRPVTRRTAPDSPRTSAAAAARNDPATAEALREKAIAEAVDALTAGRPLTSKDWGVRYGKGEEWGRKCLIAARARLAPGDPARVNGSPIS